MINVLIADDHTVVRQGLKQILSDDPQLTVVGEAADGNEVLTALETLSVDALVLDITMPGRNGLDVLKEVKRKRPTLPVLVLSMHPEDQFAIRILRAGAAGYITKESAPEELVGALRKVCSGGKYVSPQLAEKLAVFIEDQTTRPPHEKLSDREFEVLRMLALGKTVTEVAEELLLSVKTVSTYRSRVLEKMKMTSNADLTRYALQNELIT
ncbi:MAG TPA: response regulator transcription factor [Pyrinomonadaceae bacterium]|nr:response regulator transcription factor [Pyrinomonadaceae bacterium]